ncbi:hypothetical protein BDZ45DRAFT_739987 [Acephala macrosclerotiorum]|nr:hypothetical protein BDZ45DRAFT_739987 [Acephala macrosclerotiorum]
MGKKVKELDNVIVTQLAFIVDKKAAHELTTQIKECFNSLAISRKKLMKDDSFSTERRYISYYILVICHDRHQQYFLHAQTTPRTILIVTLFNMSSSREYRPSSRERRDIEATQNAWANFSGDLRSSIEDDVVKQMNRITPGEWVAEKKPQKNRRIDQAKAQRVQQHAWTNHRCPHCPTKCATIQELNSHFVTVHGKQ